MTRVYCLNTDDINLVYCFSYELILSRLIKHTDEDHPDHHPLSDAIKLVHDILLHLNCKEREALESGQRESSLRELEVKQFGLVI